jgi:hypothetical protein
MVKSYETLVDSEITVDVNTGLVAASRLQAVIESNDYSREIAEMRVQVSMIAQAVRSVVPQSMWGGTESPKTSCRRSHRDMTDIAYQR